MPKLKTSKEMLLLRSMEVFHKQGYYKTTFSDLANACEIEKPHFFYYFKDKKDLMRQVLIFAHQKIKMSVFDIANNDEISRNQKIDKIKGNLLKIHKRYPYGCFMGNTVLETASNETAFQNVLKEYFDDWQTALARLYAFRHSEEESGKLAFILLKKLQGSILFSRLYNDILHLEETLNDLDYLKE